MKRFTIRTLTIRILFIILLVGMSSYASAAVIWQNALPTANLNGCCPPPSTRSNAAPLYGSLPDANLMGSPNMPYILGDQFNITGNSTINSFTIYEVGNVPTTSMGIPGDNPSTEFSNISLYVGPDNSPTGIPLVGSLSGASLLAASSQVCYGGLCGAGGLNYQSINTTSYFAIYSVTFSGLNLNLGPGLYDFAIGATAIGSNTFALHTSDPTRSGATENSNTIANPGFLYFFYDGSGGTPVSTYQYAPGSLSNWSNPDPLDVNVVIQGSASPVPEPATLTLLGAGLIGLVALRKRKR